ncbi:MAG: DUF4381 family protein [Gammaproteobacteria bacterium]|nr:DUF4381 family protein [Gammaproteobacteria bacterium]
MNPDPLAQLRDIHPPPPPSWWPPAPGWWILALLVLLLTAWGLRAAQRRHRNRRFAREAKRRIDRLWRDFERDGDSARLAKALLVLARQTARSIPRHEQAAALPTDQLLALIDATSDSQLKAALALDKVARLLYAPTPEALTKTEARTLFVVTREWIRRAGGPLW